MKVIIHESQFERMINNSHRWGLIGISEGRPPKFSPEEEDKEIERIINKVKETGEFSFNTGNLDYEWLYRGKNRKIGGEKFKKALSDIREILGKRQKQRIPSDKEDEEIERIINKVKETGEFSFHQSNPKYLWLYRGKNREIGWEKFEKALKDINEILGKRQKQRIPSDKEDEEIERIINNVRQTGEFSFITSNPDYLLLKNGIYRKIGGEKFKKALSDIREILGKRQKQRIPSDKEDEEIERIINNVRQTGEFRFKNENPNYLWLYRGKNREIGWEKFEKALKDINEILGKRQSEMEDERIERIINNVRQTGEFDVSYSNPDFNWLRRGKNREIGGENFEKALNDIKKILGKKQRIPSDKEEEEIERIINKVKETGEFSFNTSNPKYLWLYRGKNREIGWEKFEKAIKDIKEIFGKREDEEIERIINNVRQTGEFRFSDVNPNFRWLRKRKKREIGGEKFKKALNDVKKILIDLGFKRGEWWGERTIKQILKGMEFTDIPDDSGKYIIDDCKNSLTCKHYKFDVYLPYNETNHMINENIPETGIIFEYDGRQHFEAIDYFGGDKGLEARIHSDREKNSYCQNHKPNPIKLVRIPYTSNTEEDIKRDIESALNNSSNFILTGDYPKAGWNQ